MPNAHAKGRAASNGDYAAIKNGSPQLLIPCTALLTLLIVLLRPCKRKRFAFPSIKHFSLKVLPYDLMASYGFQALRCFKA